MTEPNSARAPYLLLVAAEPSGDAHAAHLVEALRALAPELRFGAFGGPALRRAGCELHDDLMGSATMVLGFARSLGRFLGVLRRFEEVLAERRPAAVVLIDSPGLNFLLARFARWRRIPIAYYICPQIWAWAPWRRWKVLRWTDLLMAILPFEEELYRGGGVPVRYVGHPLADELSEIPEGAGTALRERLGIGSEETVLALFPGSRRQEIDALAEVFSGIARRVTRSGVSVVASAYRPDFRAVLERSAEKHGLDLRVVEGDARPLMTACDVAVTASGTASLELAYFEKPMVVLYRTNRTGYRFFEYFRVTPWISLPNILGCGANDGATVAEKLFYEDPTADAAAEVDRLLRDPREREAAVERLRRMKEAALRTGGVAGAAETLLSFLRERGALPP